MRDLSKAIEIIKAFEGLVDGNPETVKLDPYICPAGYWTIGWGHVVRDAYGKEFRGLPNKKQAAAIYPGGITVENAVILLHDDIRKFAALVESLVKVAVNDNQFSALVSFAFNVGAGNLNRSSLLRQLNAGNHDQVPVELMKWTKAGGKVLPGLVKRRAAEAKLWNTV